MDHVLLSLSASELEPRQRVAVNTDAGWFLGTVKIVKTKYATVLFDDGDTAEVLKKGTASDYRLLPPNTPKSKKAYKAKEIRELIEAMTAHEAPAERKKVKERETHKDDPMPVADPQNRSDTSLDDKHTIREVKPHVAPLPPKPPVPKMRTIGVPVGRSTAPVPDVKHSEHEDPMEQMRVVYESQIRGSTDHSVVRRFLLDLWTVYNRQKFGGQLRPIKKFLVIPASGRYGIRAFWHGTYRILVFTNLVMKSNWDKFSEIFGHELCHQAVTDVDHNGKYSVGEEGGHGPDWQAWMHKIGLVPKRYDDSTFSEYMSDEDKELFDKHADNAMSEQALAVVRRKEQQDDFKARKLIKAHDVQIGSFVTVSTGFSDEAVEGVVFAKTDRHGIIHYDVTAYSDYDRGRSMEFSEKDDMFPLYFLREPKRKYRDIARRLAETARKEARKKGTLR